MKRPAIVTILGLILACTYLGHGGGTDSYGCHRDTRAGDYHCHSGAYRGRSFASQAAMLRERNAPPPAQSPAAIQPLSTATSPPAGDGFMAPYSLDLYGSWIDADGDCQNTRIEALLAQDVGGSILSSDNCRILAGTWYDALSGLMLTDIANVDVDSFIPLAEVHRSGGDAWRPEKRQAFANDLSDPRMIIAIRPETNRDRGDKDPSQWLPPNPDYQCLYVVTWKLLKRKWGLYMDQPETNAIQRILTDCEESGKLRQQQP